MANLHDIIMNAVKAQQQEHNNVTQNKGKPNNVSPEPLRLSCNYTTPMSAALYEQLERYCEANRTTPVYKRKDPDAEPMPMPKSRVVRRAVYEAMANPSRVANSAKPFRALAATLPPERTNMVSWTMPQSRPQDQDRLGYLYPSYGGDQSTFVRRAIFNYTSEYRSEDRDKDTQAASDAWL